MGSYFKYIEDVAEEGDYFEYSGCIYEYENDLYDVTFLTKEEAMRSEDFRLPIPEYQRLSKISKRDLRHYRKVHHNQGVSSHRPDGLLPDPIAEKYDPWMTTRPKGYTGEGGDHV